jgi:hypothetical protein
MPAAEIGLSSSSSSFEQVLRMAISMSVIFSPTKGNDQVKTSMNLEASGVRCAIESPNIYNIVLVLQYSRFVVDVKVVRSTEYRHNIREACRSSLPIHTIAGIPGFVSANDGQKVALFEKGASSRI